MTRQLQSVNTKQQLAVQEQEQLMRSRTGTRLFTPVGSVRVHKEHSVSKVLTN